jgi:Ca2+-binding RTX toxin-like protein
MIGGNGNDVLDGKGGEDILVAGAGNDILDGGCKDGADDIVYGGDGNDLLFWGPTQDGSDVFFGGDGNDEITLDLADLSEKNIHDAYDNGTLDISLVDINGNPVQITDDMWSNGALNLPEGISGTITGPSGNVLTFTEVEVIKSI